MVLRQTGALLSRFPPVYKKIARRRQLLVSALTFPECISQPVLAEGNRHALASMRFCETFFVYFFEKQKLAT